MKPADLKEYQNDLYDIINKTRGCMRFALDNGKNYDLKRLLDSVTVVNDVYTDYHPKERI